MDFSARYIFIKSSSSDIDEEKTKDLFDTVIVDEGDVEKTAASISEFIFKGEEADAETNGDANMADAPSANGEEEA